VAWEGGFGCVVATKGVFQGHRVRFDSAHVSAPHDSQEGRQGSSHWKFGAQQFGVDFVHCASRQRPATTGRNSSHKSRHQARGTKNALVGRATRC
jgi:hypothetical protein